MPFKRCLESFVGKLHPPKPHPDARSVQVRGTVRTPVFLKATTNRGHDLSRLRSSKIQVVVSAHNHFYCCEVDCRKRARMYFVWLLTTQLRGRYARM